MELQNIVCHDIGMLEVHNIEVGNEPIADEITSRNTVFVKGEDSSITLEAYQEQDCEMIRDPRQAQVYSKWMKEMYKNNPRMVGRRQKMRDPVDDGNLITEKETIVIGDSKKDDLPLIRTKFKNTKSLNRVYKTNYNNDDPLQAMKQLEKCGVELVSNDLEFFNSANELSIVDQTEIVNMLAEYYKNKQETHLQCQCSACTKLVLPFLVRNDLINEKWKIGEMEARHSKYLQNCLSSVRPVANNASLELKQKLTNNIFWKKVNLGEIRIKHIYSQK